MTCVLVGVSDSLCELVAQFSYHLSLVFFLLSNLISSMDDKMHLESMLAVREGACAAMVEYKAEKL